MIQRHYQGVAGSAANLSLAKAPDFRKIWDHFCESRPRQSRASGDH